MNCAGHWGCESLLLIVSLAIFWAQNFTRVVPFGLKQPHGAGIYDYYPYLDEALNL